MIRIFTVFLIPVAVLYSDIHVEEFENLVAYFIDEGSGFHLHPPYRVFAAIGLSFPPSDLYRAAIVLNFMFYQPGMDILTGANILDSMRFRLLRYSGPQWYNLCPKKQIYFSLLPRDLSSRNNF